MNNIALNKEIKRIVHSYRFEKGYICTIDLLIELKYLSKKDYEDWRFGRVSSLEKVCITNLSKLTYIVKTMRKHALDIQLSPSITEYSQFGKGINRKLQFSKSGINNIEESYSTHYIDRERIAEIKEIRSNKLNIKTSVQSTESDSV